MPIKKLIVVVLCFLCVTNHSFAQISPAESFEEPQDLGFNYHSLIIPSLLIGYGIIGLESHTLRDINFEVKEEVNEHIDRKFTIDDFAQYAPMLSVYSLNSMGVQGYHDFGGRTMVLSTAYLIMGVTVNGLKKLTHIQRPDGSTYNSFPSGHTATAFMGAEFLRQEYSDVSIWYGVAGYLVAAGTGAFRIYNDRHWLTDVLAGAGIGILSTKIAYWLTPTFTEDIAHNESTGRINGIVMPFYNAQGYGVGMSVKF